MTQAKRSFEKHEGVQALVHELHKALDEGRAKGPGFARWFVEYAFVEGFLDGQYSKECVASLSKVRVKK